MHKKRLSSSRKFFPFRPRISTSPTRKRCALAASDCDLQTERKTNRFSRVISMRKKREGKKKDRKREVDLANVISRFRCSVEARNWRVENFPEKITAIAGGCSRRVPRRKISRYRTANNIPIFPAFETASRIRRPEGLRHGYFCSTARFPFDLIVSVTRFPIVETSTRACMRCMRCAHNTNVQTGRERRNQYITRRTQRGK